jgi:hypothetical protein
MWTSTQVPMRIAQSHPLFVISSVANRRIARFAEIRRSADVEVKVVASAPTHAQPPTVAANPGTSGCTNLSNAERE